MQGEVKMSDVKKLTAELDKAMLLERKQVRDNLPTMLDLVVTYIKIAKFEDVSIVDDANDLEEKVLKALK